MPDQKPPIFDIAPDPDADGLTTTLSGFDSSGQKVVMPVVTEKPLTIYLNSQEIVTVMSIGNYPRELAVGFLRNQNMINRTDHIIDIDYDAELNVVVVRTDNETNYESKLKKRIRTSGCAQGTIYGDIIDQFSSITLATHTKLSTSQLIALSKHIHTTPSIYLKAGAIHGCVLCTPEQPLIYIEDIGRHNAVDKIAGYMHLHHISGRDKIFYTTGRLTSEMIIKTVLMEIPILISRSGFTEAGVKLARDAHLTLIGRAKGSRFFVLSGKERIIFDTLTSKT